MQEGDLERLDRAGYIVLDALAYVKSPPKPSAYTPHMFTCMDGQNYWIKQDSQQGLVAELVGGRLASRVDAGPHACVVRVPSEALTGTPAPESLAGVRVASRDMAGAVNMRDLGVIGVTTLDAKQVDAPARARVVAFQSWIGANDAQVMLDMVSGRASSVDHGDVFGNTATLGDPTLVITDMPGIARNHGCNAGCVAEAVEKIESLGDDDLLQAVAGVPLGEGWRSEPARRLQIAQWLSHRRDRLREAMKSWV